MGVSLAEFAHKLAFQRGLIRPNKGPSIVPLLIVHFTSTGLNARENPGNHPLLVNVCQRTGTLSWHRDLTKWYSMGSYNWHGKDWFNGIDVVSLKYPSGIKTSRILQIVVQVNRVHNDEFF